MDMGLGDGEVSDTTTSVTQATGLPDAGDQSFTSTALIDNAQPSSSLATPVSSATPALSEMPVTSSTPVSGVKGMQIRQYIGYIPLPPGSAAHQLSISAAHAGFINIMMPKVYKLLKPSKGLTDKYRGLVKGHTDGIEVINTQALLDLNKCSSSVRTTIGEWRMSVEGSLNQLGVSLGISAWNNETDVVRVCTVELREVIDMAEEEYIKAKDQMLTEKAVLEAKMKEALDVGVRNAVDKFIQEKMAAAIDMVGPNGDLSPFIAQITQEVADFTSCTARIKLEYSDFKMRLQTTEVLQQIKMLLTMARILPIMCYMRYLAPAQRLVGLPVGNVMVAPVVLTVSKPVTGKGGLAKGAHTLTTVIVSTTSTTTITTVSVLAVSTTASHSMPCLSSGLTPA